ncbi:hypothetical protein BOTBODRAFT_108076 [Botryobasidium botryosum FD-172 SS1]|uniref:HAT C-terminal dimerisation domain-containing protein n=1 Tax=Botryobasidium botryosum (strain FD-172 SS1) TaxID=930990 RepID=A0A067MJP6_BOTB1|nr:hypothetical protein BOTBODRAFT_108076 [Botryobasidium botryosum FD-172 SS1]
MSQLNTPLVSEVSRYLPQHDPINTKHFLLQVIPLIDDLHAWLKDVAAAGTNHLAVCHAAQRGISALNKYYSLTDESHISRFGLFLHPMYKTEYMRAQEWPASWIATYVPLSRSQSRLPNSYFAHRSLDLIRGVWKKYTPKAQAPALTQAADPTSLRSRLNQYKTQMRTATTAATIDQLESYPAQEPLSCKDPLQWWQEKHAVWLELAQMAMDYLSIPATSVDVERAFSYGRRTISLYRHSLSSDTIRASIVFGNRCIEGLVDDNELVEMIKAKAGRGGRPQRVVSEDEDSHSEGEGDDEDEDESRVDGAEEDNFTEGTEVAYLDENMVLW